MFKVTDSTGKQLHIDDEVKLGDKSAVVIAFLSETEVQVVLDNKEGTQIVRPEQLEVTRSLYAELLSVSTMDELRKLFERAKTLIPLVRDKKPGKGNGKAKAATVVALEEEC